MHVRGRAGKLPHADGGQLCSLRLEHAQETMHKQRGQSSTDKGRDARNKQAILPVVVGLVLNRQHLIGHARTKVTSLVHGEAGDAAHAHANGPNDQADADSEHQNVLTSAASSGENSADEHEGADSLAEEVASIVRALGGGVGREDVALGNGVDDTLGSLELIGIHKPGNAGTRKATEHISEHKRNAAAPRHEAHDALSEHHGRVHAHGATKDKQADRDAKRPGGNGEHVARTLILGALEHGIAVHAHAKDDHEGRCAEFAEEFGKHKTLSFLSVINDSFRPRASAARRQRPGHRE